MGWKNHLLTFFGYIFMISVTLTAGEPGEELCNETISKMEPKLTPQQAKEKLIKGNSRYVANKLKQPADYQLERKTLYCLQRPFAVILGCADSRVPPEIIFDQGIGDLFVIRVAGNVGGPSEVESIEYAVDYLESSIVIVLGHERCGAVQALLTNNTRDIEAVAALMKPALSARNQPGNVWDNVAKANVRLAVAQLKATPLIAKKIAEGELEVIGGYYYLQSGKVEILE